MVTEITTMDINPGQEAAFSSAFAKVRKLLVVSTGCRSARLTRGVESPSRFVAIVEWDSVEDHMKNFVGTTRFRSFAAVLIPYFAQAPSVEHFGEAK